MNIRTLSALAEPNRLHIVEYLRDGPHTVSEIASHLERPQPQVSKHLRVLSEAGIVEMQAAAQRRIYRLQAAPFDEMDSWLDTFRQVWENRLDALGGYLEELQENQASPRKKRG